jgi:hypothetical protein
VPPGTRSRALVDVGGPAPSGAPEEPAPVKARSTRSGRVGGRDGEGEGVSWSVSSRPIVMWRRPCVTSRIARKFPNGRLSWSTAAGVIRRRASRVPSRP